MTKDEIAKLIEETTEKAVQKSEKRSDKRMQRYLGALAEDSKHNIKAVGEQHTSLVQQIAELNKKADEAKEDMDHVKMELYGIKNVADATFEEVGAIRVELTEGNEKLNNHGERITVLEQKVR